MYEGCLYIYYVSVKKVSTDKDLFSDVIYKIYKKAISDSSLF